MQQMCHPGLDPGSMDSRFRGNDTLYGHYTPQSEEIQILRKLYQFPGTVEEAAEKYAPNMVCEYLFELSQMFNNFYQKYRILSPIQSGQDVESSTPGVSSTSEVERPSTSEVSVSNVKDFRLALTQGVGITLKQGLNLLGIEAPEKM